MPNPLRATAWSTALVAAAAVSVVLGGRTDAGGALAVSADRALESRDGAAATPAVRALLPDLVQATPSKLSIVHRDGRELLAFASGIENRGAGPLVVEGRRTGSRRVMQARQVVHRSDGSRRLRPLGPLLRYETAPTHAHWHLHGASRYTLRSPGGATPLRRSRKAGFCLGDRYDATKGRALPGKPARARWTHQCGLHRPGLAAIRQGISVGWGDDYAPGVHGQWVDVTTAPAGRYVLVHRANPDRVLRERSYANNASSVLLELVRRPGEDAEVRVLARCPRTATCSS